MTSTQAVLSGSDVEEQIQIEMGSVREGVRRYHLMVEAAVKRGDGATVKAAERLLATWYEDMHDAVKGELRDAARRKKPKETEGRPASDMSDPVLLQLDPERLSVITMHVILGLIMKAPSRGVKFTQLCSTLGTQVIAEIVAEFGRETGDDSWKELYRRARRLDASLVRRWHREHYDDELWESRVRIAVGARLAWLFVGIAVLPGENPDDEWQAAVVHSKIQGKRRTVGILKGTPRLWQIVEEGHLARQHLRPRHVPMIIAPLDWSDKSIGGYVRTRTPLVARMTRSQRKIVNRSPMGEVHESLNAVQATPLRVNSRVLDVMVELNRLGDTAGGLPHPEDVPLPQKPEVEDAIEAWRPAYRAAREENDKRAAKRIETGMRIALARRFEAYPQFWIPHQLDSRGRFYPVPAYLHFQQSDHSRGILEFSDGVKAEATGKEQIAIHLANVAGEDKGTYDERVEWTMDHLDDIAASAADPIEHRWWAEQDKPFQTLAACFAMVDEEAAAHLPCQIDGSNNGIQHGAAITRDEDVAALVNMRANAAPADLYQAVLEPTREKIAARAQDGDPIAQAAMPFVIRDTTKQPTMTTIYGVTASGARAQVLAKLGAVDSEIRRDVARLIADTTLASIGTVTGRVNGLLLWLQACARNISHAGHNVRWTGPTGMPVVQSYRRRRKTTMLTPFQSAQFHVESLDHLPCNVGKQRNGVAANFTHTVDAAHKGRVAIACRRARMAFVGVHDAFVTHAFHVLRLHDITRETFVEIHKHALADRLWAEWRQLYPKVDLPEPPARGDFCLSEVIDAPYFFN